MRWGFLLPSSLPAEPQVDRGCLCWSALAYICSSLLVSVISPSLCLFRRGSPLLLAPGVLHCPLLVFLNPAVNSSSLNSPQFLFEVSYVS